MEEARVWMWAKPNIGLSSKVVASTKSSAYGDSWEEQAFEEDAAGPLGGCIWPPSSYTCTFCRREFRSAQALGGHMNVHRRDRARLKQIPSTFNNHILIPNSSLEIDQLPSRMGTLVYNKDSDNDQVIPNSPTRVLAPIIHEVCQFEENDISTPWFSSPISTEQQKSSSILTPLLWSNFTADRYYNIQDTDKEVKKFDFLDSKCKGKTVCVGTDLSVSLNVAVCELNKQDVFSGEEDDYFSFKRRKTDHATDLSFLKHDSVHRNIVSPESKVLQNSSIVNEDVDLELRLGA